jgi:predicted MFS family arabinose efflux permease
MTTIASGVAQVGVLTLIADRTSAGPSTTMVLTETVLSFGAALGGTTGGILLVAGGFIALGVGLPLASLAGALIITRRESSPPAALGHPQPT